MSDDTFKTLRHLHNVIAHRGDPNWAINYDVLLNNISILLGNLLHQQDQKILQNNDCTYKSIVKTLLVDF